MENKKNSKSDDRKLNLNQGKPYQGFEANCLKWNELEFQGKISARYGHSAVAYQSNFIYIFGGDRKDSKKSCSIHRYSIGKINF